MEYINAEKIDQHTLRTTLMGMVDAGVKDITIQNSHSMHNMCIGLQGNCNITISDSTGLYTGSYLEGPRIVVEGNVGWYAGDDMMSGELIIMNNTGCNVGAYINGGNIVIHGSTGSRVGYGMKGGNIIVCGDAGRWAAQMATGGNLIILGTLGKEIGESMYRGAIFTRDAKAKEKLGGNVFLDKITAEETAHLTKLFAAYGIDADASQFNVIRPVLSGRHTYVLFKPQFDALDTKTYQPDKE